MVLPNSSDALKALLDQGAIAAIQSRRSFCEAYVGHPRLDGNVPGSGQRARSTLPAEAWRRLMRKLETASMDPILHRLNEATTFFCDGGSSIGLHQERPGVYAAVAYCEECTPDVPECRRSEAAEPVDALAGLLDKLRDLYSMEGFVGTKGQARDGLTQWVDDRGPLILKQQGPGLFRVDALHIDDNGNMTASPEDQHEVGPSSTVAFNNLLTKLQASPRADVTDRLDELDEALQQGLQLYLRKWGPGTHTYAAEIACDGVWPTGVPRTRCVEGRDPMRAIECLLDTLLIE